MAGSKEEGRRRDAAEYDRKWLVDLLCRLGYTQEADDALQVLPEKVDLQQLQRFADRHGLSRDEVLSRMGASP